ncbi:uncharacterized protein I206_101087 [Kwoniella pini CBS 10737]|uniref:Rab-GAP TBC domain-containing protein n=1 Tax=Kwoniella pini CBS 10737 TaxID=1296096 RepID=A0A1B9IBG4_9TREE|nr:uncharacterized protein I206_00240 [Kwoniella pini CBS 10737]OCF52939.1 hypothetical protein I206_00240 [Kwoniella pini CBS 10737]
MTLRYEEDDNQRLFAFQRLLDGSRNASDPVVDLGTLRALCGKGIPNHPPHLRPLAYSLLLGIIPAEKISWKSTSGIQRERYYNLVKTFMEELEQLPSSSSSTHDKLLLELSKDLKSLKSTFWRARTNPTQSSPLRPLQNLDSPTDTKAEQIDEDFSSDDEDTSSGVSLSPILNRRALFKRIDLLNEIEHKGGFGYSSKQKGKQSDKVNYKPLGSHQDGNRIKQNGNGDEDKNEEEEQIMSPKITLSIDPSPSHPILSRLDTIKPAPIDTSYSSSLGPNSIIISTTEDSSKSPTSPITLLSPKPLPTGTASPSPFSGSLYYPETNSECLTRLLYIFLRTNPHWFYQRSFIDIISTFYLIHSGGGGSINAQSTLDYPEESTFWFIMSFFQEFDAALMTPDIVLDKLISRLYWINQPLYNILIIEKGLDLKLFAFRWINHLFLKDLPLSSIPKVYDFLLSEERSTPNQQPKVDLLIDIALSMILQVKDMLLERPISTQPNETTGLWGVDGSYTGQDDEEGESFLRLLEILRNYPLRQVGGINAVLDMADQIRKVRLDAEQNGEKIDISPPPLPKQKSQNQATDSSSAASSGILKASTSWSKAIGSFWGSSSSDSRSTTDNSKHQNQNENGNIKKQQSQLSDQNGPNQSDSSIHQDNRPSVASHLTSRKRSDTVDSTTSSIRERLSNLTASTPPTHIKSASSPSSSSLPRPLLLPSSISNRRSSGSSITGLQRFNSHQNGSSRRDSSSSLHSSSSNLSSPVKRQSPPLSNNTIVENGILSPPANLQSPPSTGLYRIGSRQRSRSSLGDSIVSPNQKESIKRDLNYGEEFNLELSTPRPLSLNLSD